jgi:translation elongation factor EF-4
LPLAEVITDFFDVMKSRSKGYASMEYAVIDYRENDLVRLGILTSPSPRALTLTPTPTPALTPTPTLTLSLAP